MSPPVLHGEVLHGEVLRGERLAGGVSARSAQGANVEGLTFEDVRDTCPSTPYIGRGRWAAMKAWVARALRGWGRSTG
ncbi:MAG TPA: hypothetical protein VGI39_21640 [Polyangiaceae bacterium]